MADREGEVPARRQSEKFGKNSIGSDKAVT
jgi:hypothetical protein